MVIYILLYFVTENTYKSEISPKVFTNKQLFYETCKLMNKIYVSYVIHYINCNKKKGYLQTSTVYNTLGN